MDSVKQVVVTPLTPLESFSLTKDCVNKVHKWELAIRIKKISPANRILMQFIVRLAGAVMVTFAIIADVLVHASLAVGKGSVVLMARISKVCFPNIPRDLDTSSPLVHLMAVFNIGSKTFFLPITILLNPERARRVSQTSGITPEELEFYKNRVIELEKKQLNSQLQIEKHQEGTTNLHQDIASALTSLEGTSSSTPLEVIIEGKETLDPSSSPSSNQANEEKSSVTEEIKSAPQKEVTHEIEVVTKQGIVTNMKSVFIDLEKKNSEDNIKKTAEKQTSETPNNQAPASPPPVKKTFPDSPVKGPSFTQGGGGGSVQLALLNQDPEIVSKRSRVLKDILAMGFKGKGLNSIKNLESNKNNQITNESEENRGTALEESLIVTRELTLAKSEVDTMESTYPQRYNHYWKFVGVMQEYFEAFISKSENAQNIEIDFSEAGAFRNKAEEEVNKAKGKTIASQRLKFYKEMYEYVKSKKEKKLEESREAQRSLQEPLPKEAQTANEELAAQPVVAVEQPKLLTTKEKEKADLIKSLCFLKVEKEAGAEENIEKSNQIVQEVVNGQNFDVTDYKSFLEKLKTLYNRINSQREFTAEDNTEEFKLFALIVKKINENYMGTILKDPLPKLNRSLALNVLKLHNVEEEPALPFNVAQTREIIKGVGIEDFNKFKNQLNDIKKAIEEGRVVKNIEKFQDVVAYLNRGAYLPSNKTTLSYNK